VTNRDPSKFLAVLTDALNRRLAADATIKPQYHFFVASMEAVSVRFSALDRLAAEFPKACINANVDLGKRQEQHQILFDFFSNAWALVESFCCGTYFIGSVLDPANFTFGIPQSGKLTKLRSINPKATRKAYGSFAPRSAFTNQLQDFLDSDEYTLLDSMRNLLVHRMIPGRTISLSTKSRSVLPHSINLDMWYDGEVYRLYGGVGLPEPKQIFALDEDCLSKQRDWIDRSIDRLSQELCRLASARGLLKWHLGASVRPHYLLYRRVAAFSSSSSQGRRSHYCSLPK
jgi:hypothetical protein